MVVAAVLMMLSPEWMSLPILITLMAVASASLVIPSVLFVMAVLQGDTGDITRPMRLGAVGSWFTLGVFGFWIAFSGGTGLSLASGSTVAAIGVAVATAALAFRQAREGFNPGYVSLGLASFAMSIAIWSSSLHAAERLGFVGLWLLTVGTVVGAMARWRIGSLGVRASGGK